jgi:hypothetical protein
VKEQPKTVGFQLDPGHYRRLEKMAQRYNMSPGQYARELVIRALNSNDEGILQGLNLIAGKVCEAATAEDLSKFRGEVTHNMKEIIKALGSLNQAVRSNKR